MANGNGKKKNGLTREQLVAAAVELNKEVVPRPQIDLEVDDDLLKSQIKETAGIMVPEEDIVSPETQAVIDALEADEDVIPTIDGKPQGEPGPVPTEPKEEDKTKEEDEGKEEDLVNLIKAAERIKELKPIVETKEKFKSLRKKMTEGAYRKEGGLEELKADMLMVLGVGNGEEKKQAKTKTKPAIPKTPKVAKQKKMTQRTLPPVGTILKGKLKGKEYTAEIVKDDTKKEGRAVQYAETNYSSLSSAAAVIAGHNMNGWLFWKVQK